MPLDARSIIDQFPTPAAVVEGPGYVFVATSAAYRQIIGGRDPLGAPLLEVVPALAERGFAELLDRVYRTGEPARGSAVPANWDRDGDGVLEEAFVDFVFQPLREGGEVYGILIQLFEVTERVRAERDQAFLLRASEALSSSLDYDVTLAAVARLAVPGLADWCAVDELAADGSVRRIVVAHPDPKKVELAHAYQEKYPPDPSAPTGVYNVIRTGEAEFMADIPDELITSAVTDEEQLRQVRELDIRSYILVPLTARGHVVGALTLVAGAASRRYTPADVDFARELARRAAMAVDNARLFRESEEARVRTEEIAIELEAQTEELQSAQAELEMSNDELQDANEELERRAKEAEDARRAAETATIRLERLQGVAGALSDAVTSDRVAKIAAENGTAMFGAASAAVAIPDESGANLEIVYAIGLGSDLVSHFRTFPIEAPLPLSDAVRERRAVYISSDAHRDELYSELAVEYPRPRQHSWAAIPLLVESRVLGGLVLGFSEPRDFEPEERAFLEALGQQCAQALERARLYEAERGARLEAEEANRAKTEFLSAMSHELRTPLNAIAGYVDLLDLGVHGPLSDAQRKALERVKRNQEILLGLISDVLNFARMEAGRIEYSSEPVPVPALLRGLEEVIGPQVRTNDVEYRQATPGREIVALGDPDRIQQILLNLLTNAAKFTEPGGTISVEAEARDSVVVIRVSDTGRGIPRDKLEAIFDPFVQVDRHRTERSQQGVGLGLAISRELARGMGGDLTVESAPDQGSTFTLTLPRAQSR
jgi:signal transduction histidine kinase